MSIITICGVPDELSQIVINFSDSIEVVPNLILSAATPHVVRFRASFNTTGVAAIIRLKGWEGREAALKRASFVFVCLSSIKLASTRKDTTGFATVGVVDSASELDAKSRLMLFAICVSIN